MESSHHQRSWQEQEDAFDLQHGRGVDLEPQEFLWHFFSAAVCNQCRYVPMGISFLNTRENGMGFRVFSGSSIMFKYLQCTASTDTYSQQWYIGKSENLNTFSLRNKTGWRPVYEMTFRNCQLEKSPTLQQNVSVCVFFFSHGSES